jgi:hypothetical protein
VVGAGRVDTLVLAARRVLGALVDVLAVRLHRQLRIALVAHALVRAHQVLTRAVTAYTCIDKNNNAIIIIKYITIIFLTVSR